MAEGFFNRTELPAVKSPVSLVAKCGACGLLKTCQSPKMPVSGKGRRKILIVGEAPGKSEDERNVQFIGDAGQKLRAVLRKYGIDPNEDCWFTNALICHPKDSRGANRTPTEAEIGYCQPNLIKTINDLRPDVIIPLGGTAVRALISYVWREDVEAITRWTGRRIPCQKLNAWICPSWHPSYLLRMSDPILDADFENHIRAAVSITGRPFDKPPDYRKRVEIIYRADTACQQIMNLYKDGRCISFDYETDRLKPDHPERQIVCCAIAYGDNLYNVQSFAYPWHGMAIDATKKILYDKRCAKIGFNMKFESRWSKRALGIEVRNWDHDGQLMAHVLDNRPGTKSLKFQAFVNLGQDSYDDYIRPYLDGGGGGNDPNRVLQADRESLLLYCGLDALLEYKLAVLQKEQINAMLYRRSDSTGAKRGNAGTNRRHPSRVT